MSRSAGLGPGPVSGGRGLGQPADVVTPNAVERGCR